jgi:hypothetical protein
MLAVRILTAAAKSGMIDKPEKWPEAGWKKMQARFFIVLVSMRPVDVRK